MITFQLNLMVLVAESYGQKCRRMGWSGRKIAESMNSRRKKSKRRKWAGEEEHSVELLDLFQWPGSTMGNLHSVKSEAVNYCQ